MKKTSFRSFNLNLKLMIYITVLIIIGGGLLSWYFQVRSRAIMIAGMEKRGRSLASNLAYNARFGVVAEDRIVLKQLIEGVLEDEDILLVEITNREGGLLASVSKTEGLEDSLPAPSEESFLEAGERSLPLAHRQVFEIYAPVVVVRAAAPAPGFSDELSGFGLTGQGLQGSAPPHPAPAEEKPQAPAHETISQGLVRIIMTPEGVEKKLNQVFASGMFFTIGLILVQLLVTYLFINFLLQPLQSLVSLAQEVAQGNLTRRVEVRSGDEIGVLARSFNQMIESLNQMVQKIRAATTRATEVGREVGRLTVSIAEGSNTQAQGVEETSASTSEMETAIREISQNTTILASTAEEGASSILEMSTTIEEVAQSIEHLFRVVEETSGSINQMDLSIKQVAESSRSLSGLAEETATAIEETDSSIRQVKESVSETHQVSERVSQDAEKGMKAVQSTIEGMMAIRESSQGAATVIYQLGERVQEIGKILNVIEDVADQTNLLALNAAIIASQAGEYGKGFAVVADQIKSLADRTRGSTKEIAALIKSVQQEGDRAVKAIELGEKSVERGVILSREAGEMLKTILSSSQATVDMARRIAEATTEQARGSRQIAEAAERITSMSEAITKATQEQSQGSAQVIRSAEGAREVAQMVKKTTQEQAKGSKTITEAVERITEMVRYIDRATQEQNRGIERVVQVIQRIREVVGQNLTRISEMQSAVKGLDREMDSLHQEVERFQL